MWLLWGQAEEVGGGGGVCLVPSTKKKSVLHTVRILSRVFPKSWRK